MCGHHGAGSLVSWSVNVCRAVILKLNRREKFFFFFFLCIVFLGVSLALLICMHCFSLWFVPSVKARFTTVSL